MFESLNSQSTRLFNISVEVFLSLPVVTIDSVIPAQMTGTTINVNIYNIQVFAIFATR